MKSLLSLCSQVIKRALPVDTEEHSDDNLDDGGQDHVFTFYHGLSHEEQRTLDEDFDDIGLEEAHEAFVHAVDASRPLASHFDPPRLLNWELKRPPPLSHGANLTKLADVGERRLQVWMHDGLSAYQKEKVAILIMCGGVDKMGEEVPKAALDIGLLSHKSMFQLYCERIVRLQHLVFRRFKQRPVHIPIYIMCNRDNRDIIEDFFRENNFFGVREQDLLFFVQNYMPLFDTGGKMMLANKHTILQRPCGNGAVFRAIVEQGMVSDMKSRGVSIVYMCSCDNLLCKVGDPLFLGYFESCKVDASVKCVEKFPEDHFGVLASKKAKVREDTDGDGKMELTTKLRGTIIEFSEMPDELKKRRDKLTGCIEMNAGNLSQYVFKVDFSMRAFHHLGKRWHAKKERVQHIDIHTGKDVRAPRANEQPNAIHVEQFVGDSLDLPSTLSGLEVPRTEMALVLTPAGRHSPLTALQAIGRLHQHWIAAAGGHFSSNKVASDREDAKCEVSPLVSYDGEDLLGHFPRHIELPFYLASQQELTQFSAASSTYTRRPSIHYLDDGTHLAQREQEVELEGTLGKVMDAIGNEDDYLGERSVGEEALPDTPRPNDGGGAGRSSPRHEGGASGRSPGRESAGRAKSSSKGGPGHGDAGGPSPRGNASPRGGGDKKPKHGLSDEEGKKSGRKSGGGSPGRKSGVDSS